MPYYTTYEGKVENMDKGRKAIRICLLCVVLIAIIVGLVYYYHQMEHSQSISEGTLVQNLCLQKR